MAPAQGGVKLGGAELLAPLCLQHTAPHIAISPVDTSKIDEGPPGVGRPKQASARDEAAKAALCEFVDKLDDGARTRTLSMESTLGRHCHAGTATGF